MQFLLVSIGKLILLKEGGYGDDRNRKAKDRDSGENRNLW